MKMSPPPLPWLIGAFLVGAVLAISFRVKLAIDQQVAPTPQIAVSSPEESATLEATFARIDVEARLRAALAAYSVGEDLISDNLLTDAEMPIASLPASLLTDEDRARLNELVYQARMAILTKSGVEAKIETAIKDLRQTPYHESGSPATRSAMAGAIADQIKKAMNGFVETRSSRDKHTYLMGYGHYQTADMLFQTHRDDIGLYSETGDALIEKSLLLLADFYPSPRLPDAEMP